MYACMYVCVYIYIYIMIIIMYVAHYEYMALADTTSVSREAMMLLLFEPP